ncbi:HAAS domain-containing protein [Fredinandcohnia sp. 179-A 10B2 NHS]|uniref:HAAS domain-containing protein n=1 Tax=Fredinandcohnia sp. 179-A 10B2 NHS TaxID=3235176 RepID=UPI0039A1C774
MTLSKESQEFLKNVRVYLVSSGKNEQEIEDMIEELEDHLNEAEKNGKSVDDIIGMSPREYMNSLSEEMSFDLLGVLKYMGLISLGVIAYIIMGDAIKGELEYSVLELIGYPLIYILFLFLTASSFKYVSSTDISKAKEWTLFFILGLTPITLFIALIFLNRLVDTPTIVFNSLGRTIAITISIFIFVGISIWSKTWISIILPIVLIVQEILFNMTNLQEETKLILTSLTLSICMGIYLLLFIRKEKKNQVTN